MNPPATCRACWCGAFPGIAPPDELPQRRRTDEENPLPRSAPPAPRPEDDQAVLQADNLATAGPQARTRATPVVFYGRTAHAAGTSDSQAERHRQLALCRSVIAAYGGQVTTVYFDEGCRADHPWNRRPQGQALLAALSRPAHPSWTLAAADAWRLLPRRTPADGTDLAATRTAPRPAHVRRYRRRGAYCGGIRPAGRTHVRHCRQHAGDAGSPPGSIPPAALVQQRHAARQPHGGEPG